MYFWPPPKTSRAAIVVGYMVGAALNQNFFFKAANFAPDQNRFFIDELDQYGMYNTRTSVIQTQLNLTEKQQGTKREQTRQRNRIRK